MTEIERRQINALVKSEVVPAIGCTEPIAWHYVWQKLQKFLVNVRKR